uniref:SFRICE_014696 n=1 Tax=Spodoptera frugiperda TaxID=7108 RepID=A0A2H1W502_SPOFR
MIQTLNTERSKLGLKTRTKLTNSKMKLVRIANGWKRYWPLKEMNLNTTTCQPKEKCSIRVSSHASPTTVNPGLSPNILEIIWKNAGEVWIEA